ncbi:hypothetical protein A5806_002636 [Enterococcus faecium]|nr:hypothetical protein A5806_002636 [Enterococcus faecium]
MSFFISFFLGVQITLIGTKRSEAIDNKKKFTKKALTPQFEYNNFSVCYKVNIFNQLAEDYEIKVYKSNDWIWDKIEVRAKTDLVRR